VPKRILLLLALGLAACERPSAPSDGATPSVASLDTRPNVVVIMTDDQTVENMRALPTTQELIGTAGVTFTNSIVVHALCCPSRATFLTGQYSHNHGVRSNAAPDGGHAKLDHTNTIAVWLQAAGYVTGHVGKYLNSYGDFDKLEVPPGWTEWRTALGITAYNYANIKMNENGVVVQHGPDEYGTDLYTDMAVDFIRRHASPDAPFFLWVNYLAPHWGYPVTSDPIRTAIPAARHRGLFAGATLPTTPRFNEANVSDKPLTIRSQPLISASRQAELQHAHRLRLESLLSVDEGVERIMAVLGETGVLANTMVIFTSDNGWYSGEHRIIFGKILPYDPAVKVPLLIRGPGIIPRRVGALVANIDLAPTILEATGATAGRVVDGTSLWPFLSGTQTTWAKTRHVLVEDSQRGTASTVFWSIRRGAFTYVAYNNGDKELYDSRSDTAQVTSKHLASTHTTIRNQLATRLNQMKACAGPVACCDGPSLTWETLKRIIDELGPIPPRPVIIVAEWIPNDSTEGLRRTHGSRDEFRISRLMWEALKKQAVTVEQNYYEDFVRVDGAAVEFEKLPPKDFIEQLCGPQAELRTRPWLP
jgi:N-acetylglucosamine-6-sulfatase